MPQPPDPLTPPTDLIRVSKAARMLDLHVSTLYRFRDDGRLPMWLLGRRYRVSEADVRALLVPAEPKPRAAAPRVYSDRARRLRDEHTQRVLEAAGIRRRA